MKRGSAILRYHTLEHCAQKWAPVLRKNNAATQELRAFLRFRLKAKRSSANPEQVKSPATTHLLTKQRARAFFMTAREWKMLSVSRRTNTDDNHQRQTGQQRQSSLADGAGL
jgi:hypothetical protein